MLNLASFVFIETKAQSLCKSAVLPPIGAAEFVVKTAPGNSGY